MSRYITYEYWNPVTNTIFYVGAGKPIRANFHLREAKKFSNTHIPKHVNRHKINTILSIWNTGLKPTIKIVYDGNDRDAAFEEEVNLIMKHGRLNNNTGVLTNLTDGGYVGNFGMQMSDDTRNKMSVDRSGSKNPFFGKHHSNDSKKRQSLLMSAKYKGVGNPFYGKKHSSFSKKRIAETRKQQIKAGVIVPTKHSEEHKQKMSILFKGRGNPAAKQYSITSPNGEKNAIYCLSEWCDYMNVSYNTARQMVATNTTANRGPLKGWTITHRS